MNIKKPWLHFLTLGCFVLSIAMSGNVAAGKSGKSGKSQKSSKHARVLITEVHVVSDVSGTAVALEILGNNLCEAAPSGVSIDSLPNAFSSVTCLTGGANDQIDAILNVVLSDSSYLLVVNASGNQSNRNFSSRRIDEFEFTFGIVGETGEQGIQGDTGATGQTGAQGIQGETGATGVAGVQGIQGETGANGVAGVQGIQGETGANGVAGVQGIQGSQGLTGATGPVGATGTAGLAGSNGADGATGPVGATGATGSAGTNGLNGGIGPVGATGSAGANGANGTNGTNGADGATGSPGISNYGVTTCGSGGAYSVSVSYNDQTCFCPSGQFALGGAVRFGGGTSGNVDAEGRDQNVGEFVRGVGFPSQSGGKAIGWRGQGLLLENTPDKGSNWNMVIDVICADVN